MASFTCHVVCVTKRLRLERLVRRQLARMVHSPTPATCSPTPEPNTTTPGTDLAGTPGEPRCGLRQTCEPLGRATVAEAEAARQARMLMVTMLARSLLPAWAMRNEATLRAGNDCPKSNPLRTNELAQ